MKKFILFLLALAFTVSPNQYLHAEITDPGNYDVLPGSLLTDATDNDVLRTWLGNYPLGTLLYRRSVHGPSSTTFHNLCDNQGPTIVLIKTSQNTVFGGFASVPWNHSNNAYSEAHGSFLFNLTTDQKADKYFQYAQYGIYNRINYGPTFGGGHDIYLNSTMDGGYVQNYSYEPLNGTSHRTPQASTALAGPGLILNSYYGTFPNGFIQEIEVYAIEYNYSAPDVVVQDVNVYLDSSGQANLTAEEVDNGTSDPDGPVTISIDLTSFDCSSLGSGSTSVPVEYIGTQSQPTQSHGGGFNPHTNEFWYPQWSINTVYRYSNDHQYLGTFNSGQQQIMQLWMDLESTDYYTANWGFHTISRWNGSSTIWSYNMGDIAGAVTTDDNYVYAYRFYTNYIVKLDKETGTFVENISLPGSMYCHGNLVYSNGYLYIGAYALGWSSVPNTYNAIHTIDLSTGNYIGSISTPVPVWNTAFDGETMWISNNTNTIYGYKVSEGNAYLNASGINAVTFTATDPLGFTASATAIATVLDTISPSIALNGDDTVYLDLGVEFLDPGVILWDNCTTQELTVGGDVVDVNVFGEYNVTYDVMDKSGNEAEQAKRVVIVMDPAPVALAQDISVELDENGLVTVDPQSLDGGSTSQSGIASYSLNQSDFDCSHVGDNLVTLTVTDVNGNTDTDDAIVTVNDVVAPIVAIQDISIELDAGGQANISATDVDNGSSDACGIASMALDKSSFDCIDVGEVVVNLSVTDINGNEASAQATVTVVDAVAPIAETQSITLELDESGQAGIVPGDIDNGSSDACGIASLALDVTSFDCSHVGENTVILTVTDVNGNVTTKEATVTVEDNVAPSVLAQDITIQLDASGHAIISPDDMDNGSSDACGLASLAIDKTEFDCSNVGENIVTFTVTDTHGNAASVQATVNVEDVVVPEVLTQNISVALDASGNASILPQDVDNGSSDACGIASMALDISSFNCDVTGDNIVMLTVTDINGNEASAEALVTVMDNMAPMVVTQPITVSLDADGQVTIEPADVDNGSSDACGIASMILDIYSFGCADVGDNPVILTVTDVNGNTALNQAIVTVVDDVAPAVATQDVFVVLDASGNVSIAPEDVNNGSTDACGIASMVLDVSSFDCSMLGENLVTLTVTDVNGNSASEFASVYVEDNIPPEVVTQDITIYLDENGQAEIIPGDVDNGSSDACGIASMTLDGSSFDCGNVGVSHVTLTVTDVNGNEASAQAIVTTVDNTAPVVRTQDITVYLDATGMATITADDIDNGSTDVCGIDFMGVDITGFDCSNVGENLVSLTVTDVNGNTSSAQALVTVMDVDPPMVITQDITLQLDVSGQTSISVNDIDAGSYDNCGIASMTLDVTDFGCSNVGQNNVILTVTDIYGNESNESANVFILNDVPEINSLEGPSGAVNIAQSVTVSGTFIDLNLVSAFWTWSDGVTTPGTISGNTVTGDYIFLTAGIYDVSLTVVDICGESASLAIEDIVVYDPNAGFVIGGGWLESPAGAYLEDPAYEGRGMFGFSASYWKGSDVPYGHLHFKLHKTRMQFKSRSFHWLVINDSKATLRGEGKINRKGNYDFEIQGYDAGRWGHHSGDLLRVRIWEKETGALVYDNGLEAPDDELTTAITRGFVYIHEYKDHHHWKKSEEVETSEMLDLSPELQVYPNPFNEYIMVEMNGEDNAEVMVEIYDETGTKFLSKKVNLLEGKIYLETSEAIQQQGLYILRIISENQQVKQTLLFRE